MTVRIVLIDDSETNLAVLRSLTLKALPGQCTCDVFKQSEEALDHLMLGAADLVIVDYSMPKMTGVEIIKRLRASPQHALTPVIMVTGSMETAVRKRALEVGATDFLTKPLNAGAYQDLIRRTLVKGAAPLEPAA